MLVAYSTKTFTMFFVSVLVSLEASSLPNQIFLFHVLFLFLLIPAARREGDVVHHPIIDY